MHLDRLPWPRDISLFNNLPMSQRIPGKACMILVREILTEWPLAMTMHSYTVVSAVLIMVSCVISK